MPAPLVSRGTTTWYGDLFSGLGAVTLASSGLGRFDVDWQARITRHGGWTTSPEELLAAAHAACYAMQLSQELAQNGTRPTRLDTAADVTFVAGTGITGIHLTVRAEVPGISPARFDRIARWASRTCPLSKALATTEITLTAELAMDAHTV